MSYVKQRIHLRLTHLRDAILMVITSFDSRRRLTLSYRDTASLLYIRAFQKKKQATLIKLANSLAQEAKRLRAVNENSMANYFATLEQVVVNQNITADWIFNQDEVGLTPEKDFTKHKTSRQLMPIGEPVDMMIAEWGCENRETIMPCNSASGKRAPSLFVMQEKRPTRTVLIIVEHVVETSFAKLPASSLVAFLDNIRAIDSTNFLS